MLLEKTSNEKMYHNPYTIPSAELFGYKIERVVKYSYLYAMPSLIFERIYNMKKNYGLTKTEEQIMELLWAAEAPMTFREIMDIATSEWGKTWKVQTLNTFLLGLQKMELIGAEKGTSCNYYYALCTKEQHIHNWTKKLVAEYYDNSFSRFVTAFVGDGKLSEEDVEELKKLL